MPADEPSDEPSYDPRTGYRLDAHAVIIGINEYQDKGITQLQFACADALAVKAVLTDLTVGRFNPDNVTLLLDKDATRTKIKTAIGKQLRRRAKRDDIVIVYYAGHGAPEIVWDPASKDAAQGIEKYLVPYDAIKDDLQASAIPMGEIQDNLACIEARTLVFFLDACYSGNAGGRTFSREDIGTRGGIITNDFLVPRGPAGGRGRVVITSCDVSEVSIEPKELGHGLFTYYLEKGLRGAADPNKNGYVEVDELYTYLCENVGSEARVRDAQMQPVLKGESRGRIVLTRFETEDKKVARELREQARAVAADPTSAEPLWRQAAALDPNDPETQTALVAIARWREEGAAELERQQRSLLKHKAAGSLPVARYDQAMDLLERDSKSFSEQEREIRSFLTDLLNGTMSVKNYVRSVELLSTTPTDAVNAGPTVEPTPVIVSPRVTSHSPTARTVAPVTPAARLEPSLTNEAPAPGIGFRPPPSQAWRRPALGVAAAAIAIAAFTLWPTDSTEDELRVPTSTSAANDSTASVDVAHLSRQGIDAYTRRDYNAALGPLEAAAKSRNPEAMHSLAMMYHYGWGVSQDRAKATELFGSAAYAEHPEAAYMYGTALLKGFGVAKPDSTTGFEYLRLSANKGVRQAMNDYGIMHRRGLMGLAQSDDSARVWYERAADKGLSTSMRNLGWLYANGVSIERNAATSTSWYLRSAKLGDTIAMDELAKRYERGLGVPSPDRAAADSLRREVARLKKR